MLKQEIEVIADEIIEAVKQGRFNEAARKMAEMPLWEEARDLFCMIESKISEYDFQRLCRLYAQYELK